MTVVDGSSHALLLPSSVQAVRTARTEVARFLRECGVDDAVIEDAVVIVSELVTNAVRHAGTDPAAQLRMECTVDPDRLRLQVTDGGGTTTGRHHLHEQGPVGGRGLSIVAALADSWSLRRAEVGTVVTADLAVARVLPRPR